MYHRALVKTHHMTSRTKISALTRTANVQQCAVLLRTGGVPGIMFVKAREEEQIRAWIRAVRELRYKDYHLVAKPEVVDEQKGPEGGRGDSGWTWGVVKEVGSVREFKTVLEESGPEVVEWWREKMGFVGG